MNKGFTDVFNYVFNQKAGLYLPENMQGLVIDRNSAIFLSAHPGWVKTDLGTEAAPMEVAEGASTVVELATMSRDDFPNGQLVHKGERLPW